MPVHVHVILQLQRGRTSAQIAAGLRVHEDTLRRYLRSRGYRIECRYALVEVGPSERGRE